jgi:hypothetical protein
VAIYYEWYVLGRDKRGKETKRKLRWRMTEQQAIEWSCHPDNVGKMLGLVPGSGEDRGDGAGYVGWGQALPGAGEVEAAKRIADTWKKATPGDRPP